MLAVKNRPAACRLRRGSAGSFYCRAVVLIPSSCRHGRWQWIEDSIRSRIEESGDDGVTVIGGPANMAAREDAVWSAAAFPRR